jgi:hypothetical protein
MVLVVVLGGCGGGGDHGDDDDDDDDDDGFADAQRSDGAGPTADATPGTPDAAPGSTDAAVTSATIGAGGGAVATDDGVVLEIPPGALPADTAITVTRVAEAGAGTVGPVFELGPDGTEFAEPVRLTLPFDPAAARATPPEELLLATRAGGDWTGQGWALVDTSSSTVTGLILHFSEWAVIPSPGGSCALDYGCFTSCCGASPPDLCCSNARNTCYCTHAGSFPAFVACYAGCVGAPTTSNFANSACMSACCTGQGGSTNRGACMVDSIDEARAVLECGRECAGASDQMSLCERDDISLDACIWDARTDSILGSSCPGGGIDSQFLYTAWQGVLAQVWGSPMTVAVTGGAYDSSSLAASLTCADGTGSGSISATWTGTAFEGTWSFDDEMGTIRIEPQW